MQTRNSYEHDLFNGERGVLVHHDDDRDRVHFAGEDGRRLTLPVDALDTLRLAYAASVHKAQGSQARAIVVPIFAGHRIMLTRNLVYTAVTRAQEVCVVVGEPAALAIAVGRTDARRRHTRLRELVAGRLSQRLPPKWCTTVTPSACLPGSGASGEDQTAPYCHLGRRMFARWPGEAIQSMTISRGVVPPPVAQARFSPTSRPRGRPARMNGKRSTHAPPSCRG